MLWPVVQHPQASGAHADLLAVPAGWSGWPICVHLRARELRRPTIPFLPWPRRRAQFGDRGPGCPGPTVRNPPLLLRRLPGQGRGGRAGEALRVLTETQVPGPGKVAAAVPRPSTSSSRTWPPFEGAKRLAQNRGPATVITRGGPSRRADSAAAPPANQEGPRGRAGDPPRDVSQRLWHCPPRAGSPGAAFWLSVNKVAAAAGAHARPATRHAVPGPPPITGERLDRPQRGAEDSSRRRASGGSVAGSKEEGGHDDQ
jgi:hypothetical protein